MAPQIPGTGVFSLEPSLGPSFPFISGLEPLGLEGIQSCFAVSGSVAEAWNLHHCGKTGAQSVYGDQGPVFVHSSLSESARNTNATGPSAAEGIMGHLTSDISKHMDLDHNWATLLGVIIWVPLKTGNVILSTMLQCGCFYIWFILDSSTYFSHHI